MRYNPPPNWPQPPAGWTPPTGWQPDPSWSPPPPGWQLWLEDKPAKHTTRNVILAVLGVLLVIGVIGAVANGTKTPATSSAPTSAAAPAAVTTAAVATTGVPATSAAAPGPTTQAVTSAPAIIGGNDEAKKDVKITACAKDSLGDISAKVLITNHSSKASNYLVTLAFDSPDGKTQLGTGLAAVNDLQPGQKSPQNVASFVTATGKFVCRVSSVTRYASGG